MVDDWNLSRVITIGISTSRSYNSLLQSAACFNCNNMIGRKQFFKSKVLVSYSNGILVWHTICFCVLSLIIYVNTQRYCWKVLLWVFQRIIKTWLILRTISMRTCTLHCTEYSILYFKVYEGRNLNFQYILNEIISILKTLAELHRHRKTNAYINVTQPSMPCSTSTCQFLS